MKLFHATRQRRFCLVASLWLTVGWSSPVTASELYLKTIKPLLKARCYACHGALKQEAGLRLDTADAIRRGGDDGSVITLGRTNASRLIQKISATKADERMPPEGTPLTADQVAAIQRWIESGATSPADETPERDPAKHWSFQPPQRAAIPVNVDAEWSMNPIDRFLSAEQRRLNILPVEAANKSQLLRRLYLDLIGLPPHREELHAFLADAETTAYERTVERLLASPLHGERWARHWMDIWRYSDWYGRRRENDVRNSYPHIWRWRDWIVQSVNSDQGYDRMLMEMLAADEIAPEDDARIAANGFLVRSWYSLNYDQWMRDLVEHTGKAFLGLRLNCALCHDHKYDPLSQEEYFQFRAFFEPLELRQDRVPGGPPLPKYLRYKVSSNASTAPIAAGLPRVYEEYQDQPTYIYRGGDARDRIEGRPPVSPGTPKILGGKLSTIEPVTLSPAAYYPGLKAWVRNEEAARLAAEVARAETANIESSSELAWADLAHAKLQQQAFQSRVQADHAKFGNAQNFSELALVAGRADRKAAVAAAQLAVLKAKKNLLDAQVKAASDEKLKANVTKAETQVTAAEKQLTDAEAAALSKKDSADYTPLGPAYPPRSTGRRRALAAWLTARGNPLVARVAVNHLWTWHFGRPLVDTVYDFGRSGAEPTHPELLDWLAVELMENDWSLKHISRLIVTSRAYRMQSSVPKSADQGSVTKAADRDPANRYWWRFERQRMEAEVLRDSLLFLASELDHKQGGQEIDNTTVAQSSRRSLYFTRFPEEGGVMPFAAQFDAPDPTDCYRRTESLVPQQALALVNSELTHRAGTSLTRRLLLEFQPRNEPVAAQRSAIVQSIFEQLLSRGPNPHELELCLVFLERQSKLNRTEVAETRAIESLVRAVLSHHDFITIH